MDCEPIGRVSTPFASTSDAPSQGFQSDAEGVVRVFDEYAEALSGFDEDRVVVVWWADRADRDVLTLDRDPGRGVFATRSPARPNPVCLTECSVLEVRGQSLRVGGVDMADDTPVIDLKSSLRGRR